MPNPILHHDRVTAPGASPARWLYVLHGIFGAGRNWRSVVQRVVRARPEWGGVLVDLREHGRSTGFPPPHTLAAAAADLRALVAAAGLPATAVLGHSFGGKVALLFGRDYAAQVGTEQLWVADSTPEAGSPRGSAWAMLELLRRHPGPFAARGEAVAALEAEGVATGVAQWVSTNLQPVASGVLRWGLDLQAMEALLLDFFRTDLWDVVEAPPDALRIHFLKAEASEVIPEPVAERIEQTGRRNGRVQLHRIAGGHWLNADNPAAVEELLTREL